MTTTRIIDDIHALVAAACAHYELRKFAPTLSPIFPETFPFSRLVELPKTHAKLYAPQVLTFTQELEQFRKTTTQRAGALARYLGASEDDIRTLAVRYANRRLPGDAKLEWTRKLLGDPVPGIDRTAQHARVNDARFWRRAIRRYLMRTREHLLLLGGFIGAHAENYVSDAQLKTRRAQLRRQAKWLEETVLVPRYLPPSCNDKGDSITLKDAATTAVERFAKLYTFVKALDELAEENNLATAMLTITLEPEWHPNPSHGRNQWNGASPREAHQAMALRWQAILRDLDHASVGVSGLRVVEPHKDGCPHWHVWLLYRREVETTILATVMKYFPNKLKVRVPNRKGEDRSNSDVVFDTQADLRAHTGRPLAHAKEGAQVEFSRINRKLSSGASYAMKYLLKTVDTGDDLIEDVGLLPSAEDGAGRKAARKAHKKTARRVDAYRALWGINSGQLFGIAKCLTAWDELRRLEKPPRHAGLRRLWVLARGSKRTGRIAAGAEIRGDAKAFIKALGGLAACGKPPKTATRYSIGRLIEMSRNGYGEPVARTRGVTLVKRRLEKVVVGQRIHRRTGEVTPITAWRSVKTIIASVRTRLQEWMLVHKSKETIALEQAARRWAAATSGKS